MDTNERPWWAPDAQGFLAFAIVGICGVALFIRMKYPSQTDDKMLDTMITILFSTCLVTVYNYSFGSSRGSSTKDEAQARVVEKLVNIPAAPLADTATFAAAATAAAIAAAPAAAAAAAEVANGTSGEIEPKVANEPKPPVPGGG